MKKSTFYLLTVLVWILLVLAGMMYTQYNQKKSSWPTTELQSKFLASWEVTSAVSREKIQTRISQIELEIIQATNDPERAIELRRELQKLRDQLK